MLETPGVTYIILPQSAESCPSPIDPPPVPRRQALLLSTVPLLPRVPPQKQPLQMLLPLQMLPLQMLLPPQKPPPQKPPSQMPPLQKPPPQKPR
uniref:Uncharacterized protein n=1 Tax=Knipowitschia caucasica TaxID=637954 RepID=A0AAV2LBM8_KNICA